MPLTFTDDDLKRLKENMDVIPGICWGQILGNKLAAQCFDLSAIIARLEAAEAMVDLSQCRHAYEDHDNGPCDYAIAYLAWRKVAGKEYYEPI